MKTNTNNIPRTRAELQNMIVQTNLSELDQKVYSRTEKIKTNLLFKITSI